MTNEYVDAAFVGTARVSHARCNNYKPDMDAAIEKLTIHSADLSLYELANFTTTGTPIYQHKVTVKGSIQPKGTNLKGLPITDTARFDQTLFCPGDVSEGDRIKDSAGVYYDVHTRIDYPVFDSYMGLTAELFKLSNVTWRRRLSASAYQYVDKPIMVSLSLRGQSSLNPQSFYSYYDYVAVTIHPVQEGDQFVDVGGDTFEVMSVSEYPFSRSDLAGSWKVCVLVKAFPAVTLYTLTLSGAADSTTGIFPSSYASSTAYMQIFNPSKNMIKTPAGYYNKYSFIGLTSASVLEGDQVTDSAGVTYKVMQVTSYPTARTDLTFTWKVLGLIQCDFDNQPATSGTWHLDSESIKTDPRNRIKTVIDTYMETGIYTATSNGAADGTTIINTAHTQADDYWNGRYVMMLTGTCAGETALISDFDAGTDKITLSGTGFSAQIDSADIYLISKLTKDDGTTGAFTFSCFDDAMPPITRLFLTLGLDAVAVISRGSSSTLYTDWVFGHKPYGFEENVTVDIYAVNKTAITASNLAEKFEQEIRRIFTAYDAYTNVKDLDTVAPDKTDLGYAHLYHTAFNIKYYRINDDYTASYPTITWGPSTSATGTYTFPNVTNFTFRDPDTGDSRMMPPGRLGDILQVLGSSDFEIVLTCDLRLAPAAKTWKRAQSGAKTDYFNWQVFDEIKFKGKTDSTMLYQTFNYGGSTTIPVRVIDVNVDGETLTVTLRRYSASSGSGGTYSAWYGN